MEPFLPNTLPPKDTDWAGLADVLGPAGAALGEYRGRLASIPHPDVLLSPLSMQEAVVSSRIEGTIATLQDVLQFEAEFGEATEREADIREIRNYRNALAYASEELTERPLGLNTIKRLHWLLMEDVRGKWRGRGEFRSAQNHIGPPGSTLENATYVPPPPGDPMNELLGNWEVYYHSDKEKDLIVQTAILHAQFELIHPFVDGNGRVGRMLIPLFLYDKKVLPRPTFYISAYLESTRDEYYGRLQALSEEADWNGWIRYFLQAVIQQAGKNTSQAEAITELRDEVWRVFQEKTRSLFALEAVGALFEKPLFNGADFHRRAGIPTRQTSANILKRLTDAEVLTVLREGSGRRSTIYMFSKLLAIVES